MAFLGLAGFAGFVISIIMTIRNLRKKRPVKKSLIAMFICLILFGVALTLTPDEDKDKKEKTPKETQSQSEVVKETVKETAKETQAPETKAEAVEYTIIDGELGEYGVEYVLDAGTEFEEQEIGYHFPAGTYTVTNNSNAASQVSVYSGEPYKNGEWDEFAMDDSCPRPLVLMPGDSGELTLADGQFVVLADDDTNIVFALKQ